MSLIREGDDELPAPSCEDRFDLDHSSVGLFPSGLRHQIIMLRPDGFCPEADGYWEVGFSAETARSLPLTAFIGTDPVSRSGAPRLMRSCGARPKLRGCRT